MKKITLLLFFAVKIAGFSQTSKLNFSNETPMSTDSRASLCKGINDVIFVIKSDNSEKATFLTYDKDLKAMPSKEIKWLQGLTPITVKGKLWYIGVEKNENVKTAFLFSLNDNGELKLVKELDQFTEYGFMHPGEYYFSISEDESKILLYRSQTQTYRLDYQVSDNYEKFKLTVFDSDFNSLSAREYEIPIMDDECNMIDWKISNTGKVYLFAAVGKLIPFKEYNYKNTLFSFDFKGEKPDEIQVDIGENFYIINEKLVLNSDGSVAIGGFYSNLGGFRPYDPYGAIRGSFLFKIDSKNEKVIINSTQEFSPEMKDLIGRMQGKAWKEEVGKLTLKSFFDYNSDIILVAENISNELDKRVYKDIFLFTYGNDGKVKWTKTINKQQVQTKNANASYYSFLSYSSENGLRIIYNDAPEGKAKIKDMDDAVVSFLKVTFTGDVHKNMIYDDLENHFKVNIESSLLDKKNNAALLNFESKKAMKLSKLILD